MTLTMKTDYQTDALFTRFSAFLTEQQNLTAAEILAESAPYVPYDSGTLYESGHVIPGDPETPAYVVWDVPYARAVYYGDDRGVTFHREKHPHASARWAEKTGLLD